MAAPKPMIKVVLDYEIIDGQPLTFTAPCNCSEAGGLRVYHSGGTREFVFRDAHKNVLHYTANVFAAGAYVKVILDFNSGSAYIQNADTNTYLETRFSMLHPLNLLDNSDFRNPVNQRNGDNYSGKKQYTIDRWEATNKIDVTLDSEYEYVEVRCSSDASARNSFSQRIPMERMPEPGSKVTAVLCDQNRGVRIFSGAVPAMGNSTYLEPNDKSALGVQISYAQNDYATFAIFVPPGEVWYLKWIALYEGEYTAETVPEYKSKGYAAELEECQRYYLNLGVVSGFGYVYGANVAYVSIVTPVRMRINPTISASDDLEITMRCAGQKYSVKLGSNSYQANNQIRFALDISGLGLTVNEPVHAVKTAGTLEFSADL